MVTTILVVLLMAAMAQGIPSYILGKRAKRRVSELEAENRKLADFVLAEQRDRLLLPEDTATASGFMELVARADRMAAEAKSIGVDDGLDRLLDLIGKRDLTGVDKGMAERRRTAIFRFGDLAVQDVPIRQSWDPDILYRDVWVGVFRGARAARFRAIVDRKLMEAVERGVAVPVGEAQTETPAEAGKEPTP